MKIGYACINSFLHSQKPTVYVNRSMNKKTFESLGIKQASKLALQNIKDLQTILDWNQKNKIYFYRMSSDMFPWMSEYNFEDLPDFVEISNLLFQIGNFVKTFKHRLTFHPGQFNVLASSDPKVVNNSINDIEKHSLIMDLLSLELSPYNKINIHIGGVYGNKSEALKRWTENYYKLSENARKRLTVENDDKVNGYTVEDLFLNLPKEVPIVLDYLHFKCNPGNITLKEACEAAFSTWGEIIPVIHISETKQGSSIRSHSDFISSYFETFNFNVDVMFEAKMKEQAVLKFKQEFELNIV